MFFFFDSDAAVTGILKLNTKIYRRIYTFKKNMPGHQFAAVVYRRRARHSTRRVSLALAHDFGAIIVFAF